MNVRVGHGQPVNHARDLDEVQVTTSDEAGHLATATITEGDGCLLVVLGGDTYGAITDPVAGAMTIRLWTQGAIGRNEARP